ncbi:MAG TPA: hypothetical protein VIK69_06890 [Methylophilaceae bacterium]|jgi:hypothetical protein
MSIRKTSCRIRLWSSDGRLWLVCAALAFGTSTSAHADVGTMNRVLRQTPSLDEVAICHGGGCARVTTTAIAPDAWHEILGACEQAATPDAETERACIAEMLGAFERVIGANTGTDTDRGGTFGNSAYPGQMDCNDEAINTTNYLKLMQQHGLLHHHEIMDIARRGFFFKGWPHTAAVIREIGSGQRYAVDSWFYDNGRPAVIVPFEVWKSGWRPDDSQAR